MKGIGFTWNSAAGGRFKVCIMAGSIRGGAIMVWRVGRVQVQVQREMRAEALLGRGAAIRGGDGCRTEHAGAPHRRAGAGAGGADGSREVT